MTNEADRLAAALEPFAREANEYDLEYGSGEPDLKNAPDASSLREINDLTVGDLRRARTVLAALSTATDAVATCPACNGSGFSVADYCGFCGGSGGVPVAVAEKFDRASPSTDAGDPVAEVTSYFALALTAEVKVYPTQNGGMPFDIGSKLYTRPVALTNAATPADPARTAEGETLREALVQWQDWYRRATADDDCEYLNGDGWADASEINAYARAALSKES